MGYCQIFNTLSK